MRISIAFSILTLFTLVYATPGLEKLGETSGSNVPKDLSNEAQK